MSVHSYLAYKMELKPLPASCLILSVTAPIVPLPSSPHIHGDSAGDRKIVRWTHEPLPEEPAFLIWLPVMQLLPPRNEAQSCHFYLTQIGPSYAHVPQPQKPGCERLSHSLFLSFSVHSDLRHCVSCYHGFLRWTIIKDSQC